MVYEREGSLSMTFCSYPVKLSAVPLGPWFLPQLPQNVFRVR